MGKRTYLGGGTVLTQTGFGFSPLPEGGKKKHGKSVPTPNQIAAQEQSKAAVAALGIDQRTRKQRHRDAHLRRKQNANRT